MASDANGGAYSPLPGSPAGVAPSTEPSAPLPPSEQDPAPPSPAERFRGRLSSVTETIQTGASAGAQGVWTRGVSWAGGVKDKVAQSFHAARQAPEAQKRKPLEWTCETLREEVVGAIMKLDLAVTREGFQRLATEDVGDLQEPDPGPPSPADSFISTASMEQFRGSCPREELVRAAHAMASQLARGGEADPTGSGGGAGAEEEEEDADIAWIIARCRELRREVSPALAWKTLGQVARDRLKKQFPDQRLKMGTQYISVTSDGGEPRPLDPPGEPGKVDRWWHIVPWLRPPRSLFYIQVRKQDFTADPSALTADEPEDSNKFPGWNMVIAVTDSEWTWQLFVSVLNVALFAVTTVTAFQQGFTLGSYGFGFWRMVMYWVATVFKVFSPFFFATQDHTADADMPDGHHRIGHRLRDLFCQAIGIRWLVRNAHRALAPEYLGRTGLDSLAKNVGSRLGCRVPLVYPGPCANQLWTEKEHMRHRLIPTIGADGVLLCMAIRLVAHSLQGTEAHGSVMIALENCVSLLISLAFSVYHYSRMKEGLKRAHNYAEKQLDFADLQVHQTGNVALLSEHAKKQAIEMKQKTKEGLKNADLQMNCVYASWVVVGVALLCT
mmetsp:Transcript_90903/g.208118  ORF Transcript_90903/g.208118 Transcript_90903/m.208118 type:complete len:611 (-) Transcript_90903:419-2251(-)